MLLTQTVIHNISISAWKRVQAIATIFSMRNPQKSFRNLLMVFYRIYCTILLDWISTLLSNTVLLSSFANTEWYLFRLVVKNTQKTPVWLTIAGQISINSHLLPSISVVDTSTNAFPCSTLFSDFFCSHLLLIIYRYFLSNILSILRSTS